MGERVRLLVREDPCGWRMGEQGTVKDGDRGVRPFPACWDKGAFRSMSLLGAIDGL